MTDPFHVMFAKPLVCIVIVKIGNTFIGLAAELSEVVSCCRPGGEGEVNGDTGLIKPAGHGHCDIVYPCDVA